MERTACVLGVDTSCYTSSVALAFADGRYVQRRQILRVAQGQRGLQQSQGVFEHVQNLPRLMEELFQEAGCAPDAVCVSARPREVEGSYMPVFTVGEGAACSVAAALGVPLYKTTHQQGHVRAAMLGTSLGEEPFLALHLSGGTTEILRADASLALELIGGTGDLNAGQFVDRVGVALGLGFPAGPALEALARQGTARSLLPASVQGVSASFSGAESAAQRLIQKGDVSREDMAAEVYSCLARSIAKLIAASLERCPTKRVLLAGGVASSALFRELLPKRLHALHVHNPLCWGKPELSGDNAVGVALIGLRAHAEAHTEK